MRDFCKISPQFWTGKTGKSLRGDAEAQLVALYLMTSPHSNMIGIFTLPIMYLAHETGLSFEGASKALERVCESGFCTFEADSDLVWVHEMARYQIGVHLDAKDKRCKGVHNELAKVCSPQLRKAFYAKYKDDFHLPIDAKKSKPLASPLQAPTKQGEGEGEGEGEEEGEEEGEGEHPLTPKGAVGVDSRFDEFWAKYPKKIGKDEARKAFAKRKPDSELLAQMLAAIAVQAKSTAWTKDSGQFIPNPGTWLNQGRWMDGEQAEQTKIWSDEYHAANKRAKWVIDAGFATSYDAQNAKCHHKNAHEFCDGKRLEAA